MVQSLFKSLHQQFALQNLVGKDGCEGVRDVRNYVMHLLLRASTVSLSCSRRVQCQVFGVTPIVVLSTMHRVPFQSHEVVFCAFRVFLLERHI